MPYLTSGDDTTTLPFQFLREVGRIAQAKTYVSMSHVAGVLDCTVQRFQRWRPGFDEGVCPPSELQAFLVEEETEVLDLVKLVGSVEGLKSFLKWSVGPSDVAGCSHLTLGARIYPSLALRSPQCPTICLIEALEAKGFNGEARKMMHVPGGPLVYDDRDSLKHKVYLQCVLVQHELFTAGCVSFLSQKTKAFYELLLRHPQQAVEGLTAAACKKILDVGDGVAPMLAALDETVECPAAAPAVPAASGPDVDSDIDFGSGQGDVPAIRSGKARPDEHAVRPMSSSSSTSSSSTSSRSSSIHMGAPVAAAHHDDDMIDFGEPADPAFPKFILGQPVKLEQHWHAGGTVASQGIRILCANPTHVNCSKYRSLRMETGVFGPRAAELYLMCWTLNSEMPCELHRRFKPSRAQVREIAETYAE